MRQNQISAQVKKTDILMLNSGQLGNGLVSHPTALCMCALLSENSKQGRLKEPSKRAERLCSRLTGHFST